VCVCVCDLACTYVANILMMSDCCPNYVVIYSWMYGMLTAT